MGTRRLNRAHFFFFRNRRVTHAYKTDPSASPRLTTDTLLETPLNSAVNAGSICPLEATNTARTTVGSIDGKASCKVAWACCWGDMGRCGFGWGVSVFKKEGLGRVCCGAGLKAPVAAVELFTPSLEVSACWGQ